MSYKYKNVCIVQLSFHTRKPKKEQWLHMRLFIIHPHIYINTVKLCYLHNLQGCAVAQEVSRWLPTVAAQVRAWVWSCGICGGQSGAGAGFLQVLQFPLPVFIPPVSPQSPSSVIWGWYNRPVVAAVPSGLSLTPLTIIIIIIHNL
jgi:hypothetical protein